MEGAGVRLRRTIAHPALDYIDPFLLLDEFKSDRKTDFIRGFPWHPHRGIETVTYMLRGRVEHGDSIGNSGIIGPGDMQWMTAGRGIIHQEMPIADEGLLWGLQLWVNLPATDKMTEPKYRDIGAGQIPSVESNNATVKILCGTFEGVTGPVKDVAVDPLYLDVMLEPNTSFARDVPDGNSVFCYCLEGSALFDDNGGSARDGEIVLFGEGDSVHVRSLESPARFLLISGRILREPIARGGPFVMNTREEIMQAYADYEAGKFI